jgi:SIR2-like domain
LYPSTNIDDIVYLKLHGSIDWWIRNNDMKIVPREHPFSLMGEAYDKRLMIYPVYDKKVSRQPFASLYNYFRALLQIHDVYIIVGYSFRDQSINDAFIDSLLKNEGSRIVIINRRPDRIMNKIQDFPHNKIDVIKIPFGEDALISELDRVLRREPAGIQF